jgi:DNA-binding GntR family transcriptional regulator
LKQTASVEGPPVIVRGLKVVATHLVGLGLDLWLTLYPVSNYGRTLDPTAPTLEKQGVEGLSPVIRPPRLKETVADSLRSLILDGSLAPGTQIRQEELARQLGVSRTPLREALVRLEAEGLVGFTPAGTATVTALSAVAASELLEMRELVDGLAARKLAQRGIKQPAYETLLGMTMQMEAGLAAGSKAAYLRANTAFHVHIATLTEHSQLLRHLPLIQLASEVVYLNTTRDHLRRMKHAVDEHREILSAINARDAEQAEHLARLHIKNAGGHWVLAQDEGQVPRATNRRATPSPQTEEEEGS